MAEEIENSEIVESGETKKSSLVYIISAVLLLLVVGGGIYFMNKMGGEGTKAEETAEISSPRPQGPQNLKGQKFTDTQISQNAYQIYPGTISEAAKTAMNGWDLKTKTLSDGTTQVDLVPTGSEAAEGDTRHSFNLETGDILYFVDLNPGDDQPGMDNNKNDDMGIVVDSQGIIQ